jgi:S1-C subfamily serine protease
MTAAAPNPDDLLAQLSAAIAARVAAAAPILAAIDAGRGRWLGGILWRPGVVVTSRQALPAAERYAVVLGGGEARTATPAGDDPGTNVAVLRLESGEGAAETTPPFPRAGEQQPGMLAVLVGAGENGRPTARLATVHATGPAWHSLAGGRIDRLLRLDGRLRPAEEGGPVLDAAAGALLGMSTSGPRGRVLVIPHETVERVLDPILREGRVGRAWLGLGLQPVEVPAVLREAAGQDSGLMVVGLASGGPAEGAGVLPGDILLAFDSVRVHRPRGLAALLGAERIGQVAELRIMRAGAVQTLTLTPAPRPARA